jgi:hypothetical protein
MAGQAAEPVLKHSDVLFMYAADDASYKAYGVNFVAWGGAENAERVKRHHDLGIRCTGSMWCLTAGAKALYDAPKLLEATARDIEGNPIEVPWLFDHRYKDMKTYFGCTNHPAFREHCREEARKAMSGGADGLHVDDHLGVAQSATAFGGGLCDSCIAAFREYLKKNATAEQLTKAGVTDLAKFDYRDLIRKYAKTREEYRKAQYSIPLMDLFVKFQLEAAADFVNELRGVGEKAAGHPILLSANAWVGDSRHRVVVKYLTHIVCETEFHAPNGTDKIDGAIETFRITRDLGKPLAATASGWDWSFVKANGAVELARFWIALTYAHGQCFMAPHPKRQWCFNDKEGTTWYAAPVEEFAPMYQFIRTNAQWFDGFEEVKLEGLKAPKGVIVVARRKDEKGPVVLHVINRDYDAAVKRMRAASSVKIEVPAALLKGLKGKARRLSYDSGPEPEDVPLRVEAPAATLELARLTLWSVIVVE